MSATPIAKQKPERTLRVTLEISFRPLTEAECDDFGSLDDEAGDFEPDDPSEWDASELADLVSGYLEATEDDEMFAGTGMFVRQQTVRVVDYRWADDPAEARAALALAHPHDGAGR